MAINGINGYPTPLLPGGIRTPPAAGPDAGAPQRAGASRGAPTRTPDPAARLHDPVPMEAPPGTDPMLWSVLTAEERTYFARTRALGQITYAPGTGGHNAGLPRGGRIDVRV